MRLVDGKSQEAWRKLDTRGTWTAGDGQIVGTEALAAHCDGRLVFQVPVKRSTHGAMGLLARDTTRFRNILCAKGIQKSGPED